MKLSELDQSTAVTVLLYGKPKVGKSHFGASACATGRWVVISNRNGLETYVGAEVKKAFPNFDVSTVELKLVDRDQSLKSVKAFQNINDICRQLFEKELDTFDGIIVEDCSFLREQARNMAILINGNTDRSQTLSAEVAKSKGSFNAAGPTAMQDQGKEMELISAFFDELTSTCRKYNKHLLCLAHEAEIYIDDKRKKSDIPQKDQITAAFTGRKEPTANSKYFSIVMRASRSGKGHAAKVRFQCKSDGVVDAGDRYGVLAEYEDNLTWEKMMDKIRKQVASSDSTPLPPPPKDPEPK
jgi:hypothetical protein